jgi:hypothetical protein
MMDNQVIKQKFQIIDIDIPGAGSEVNISKVTEADHDEITGVAIYKNGGKHGYGTIGLRIAGDEIFSEDFHAGNIMFNADNKNIVLKDVVWPVKEAGKGSQVIIKYKEPQDGAAGKMYLYLFAKKKVNP